MFLHYSHRCEMRIAVNTNKNINQELFCYSLKLTFSIITILEKENLSIYRLKFLVFSSAIGVAVIFFKHHE